MFQSIFDSVNQQLGCFVQWKCLETEGTSNHLFQGSDHQRVLVLRINAVQAMAFGVNRDREAAVLDQLQAYPWALEVVLNRPDQGWCVMRHQGVSLQGSLLTEIEKKQLLDIVSQYQQIKCGNSICTIDYDQLFTAYSTSLSESVEADYWLDLLRLLEQTIEQLPKVPLCLTHHDLHTGNLCLREAQIKVIDWEYAGIGNPWFDAYGLYQYCQISEKEIYRLPAFQSLSEAVFLQGLSKAGQACTLLEQLWYKVRGR